MRNFLWPSQKSWTLLEIGMQNENVNYKGRKLLEHFYGCFHIPLAFCLFTTKLSYTQQFNLGHSKSLQRTAFCRKLLNIEMQRTFFKTFRQLHFFTIHKNRRSFFRDFGLMKNLVFISWRSCKNIVLEILFAKLCMTNIFFLSF